jgi:hypothetical protein
MTMPPTETAFRRKRRLKRLLWVLLGIYLLGFVTVWEAMLIGSLYTPPDYGKSSRSFYHAVFVAAQWPVPKAFKRFKSPFAPD